MDNRSIMALFATIIIIGSGVAFYWYEYRPSRIRSACEMQATEQAHDFLKQMMGKRASKDLPEGLYIEANKEGFYLSCVRKQGLER
jgi:hypothetical protein